MISQHVSAECLLNDYEYSGKCVWLEDYSNGRHSVDKMYSSKCLISRQWDID